MATTRVASTKDIPTPTEAAAEPLQNAYYVYDGDGNLVKSIINGKSTYYLGKLYQKKIDGTEETIQKYYSSGSAQIAVRTVQGEEDKLQWLLSDHLGSTSTTANADGTWNSTIQYSAFGEIRASSGITPTEFRYTGQLRQDELGLYYYIARWYDPAIAHFTQADTIVPNAGDSAAYDRYAYVKNNPVKYTDPSGHTACIDFTSNGRCVRDPDWHPVGMNSYGVSIDPKITGKAREKIKNAVKDVASKTWITPTDTSISQGFKNAFEKGIQFIHNNDVCTTKDGKNCWGGTSGTTITVYSNAKGTESNFRNFIVHEMGHVFDNSGSIALVLTTAYQGRLNHIYNDHWTDMPTGNYGYASDEFGEPWFQGHHEDGLFEETADMFLGWVYDTWGEVDKRRGNWMNLWMPYLIMNEEPPFELQYGLNERTGQQE